MVDDDDDGVERMAERAAMGRERGAAGWSWNEQGSSRASSAVVVVTRNRRCCNERHEVAHQMHAMARASKAEGRMAVDFAGRRDVLSAHPLAAPFFPFLSARLSQPFAPFRRALTLNDTPLCTLHPYLIQLRAFLSRWAAARLQPLRLPFLRTRCRRSPHPPLQTDPPALMELMVQALSLPVQHRPRMDRRHNQRGAE